MAAKRWPAKWSLTYFTKQPKEDVVLILAGIHAAAKLVATLPKRGIELGFFDGHC